MSKMGSQKNGPTENSELEKSYEIKREGDTLNYTKRTPEQIEAKKVAPEVPNWKKNWNAKPSADKMAFQQKLSADRKNKAGVVQPSAPKPAPAPLAPSMKKSDEDTRSPVLKFFDSARKHTEKLGKAGDDGDDKFNDRHARIRQSLDKIGKLMADLKAEKAAKEGGQPAPASNVRSIGGNKPAPQQAPASGGQPANVTSLSDQKRKKEEIAAKAVERANRHKAANSTEPNKNRSDDPFQNESGKSYRDQKIKLNNSLWDSSEVLENW